MNKEKKIIFGKIDCVYKNIGYYFRRFFIIRVTALLANIAIAYIYQIFVDDVVVKKNGKMLVNVLLAYAIVSVGSSCLKILLTKLQNSFFENMNEHIVTKAIKKIINQKSENIMTIDFIDYKNRITEDIGSLSSFIWGQIYDESFHYILCIVYSILLFKINILFAVLCLLFIPLSFFITFWRSKKFEPLYEQDYKSKTQLDRFTFQTFEFWKEVKAFNIEKKRSTEYLKMLDDYGCFRQKLNMYNYFNSFLESMQNTLLLNVSIYLFGTFFIISQKITFGELLIFVQFFGYFYSEVLAIQNNKVELGRMLPSIKRIFNLLFELKDEEQKDKIKDGKALTLEVNHVSFGYNEKMCLNNINFEVNAGEKIVIVGKSGSGKSTLLKLLLNLYRPMEGSIKIGGEEISNIPITKYYSYVSAVLQEPAFLDTSIIENFKLINDKFSISEIEVACKKVGIYNEICNLPDSFNTVIGENGGLLSKGQRQRLAVARLLMIDSPIMLFDEVTASIDTKNKETVLDAILSKKDKIIMVVTHDLSFMSKFDKIILVDNGTVEILTEANEVACRLE
jgi:ABC-type multidrug transport system, ATPase and permease components